MSIRHITPEEARRLQQTGALLVDIRAPDEHARERIPGATLLPVGEIARQAPITAHAVILHCRSGGRTRAHASALAGSATGEAYILEGGLDAWKRAGLPVVRDERQPLELMRQVQITAGSIVLLATALGATVSSAFYFVAAFVGAGLMFAGVTGTCALARVLQLMPWNRPRAYSHDGGAL